MQEEKFPELPFNKTIWFISDDTLPPPNLDVFDDSNEEIIKLFNEALAKGSILQIKDYI